ncbi:MAG: hypothetical protein V2A53_04610 [bacterium]
MVKQHSLSMLRRIKLTLSYDGTDYYGFQRQKDKPSVQGRLEEALFKITKCEIQIQGASRIDRGAHAEAQVVAFWTGSKMTPDEMQRALNSVLPKDIVVLLAEEVSGDFNPRHAKERVYRYTILNQEVRSVFFRRYSYFIPIHSILERCRRQQNLLLEGMTFLLFLARVTEIPIER